MIHQTAIIDPHAGIGSDVEIGPYCVIGANVQIGDGCVLKSHVVIDGHTKIGKNNTFYPFAAIGQQTQDLKYQGEPTYLEIGDSNVFRENVTIHRGTTAELPTRIGNHNYFLCYSHVAHDCQVGDHCILSNNATLAGHVEVYDYAIISGLTPIHQFARVGEHAMVGGFSRVSQDTVPFMMLEGSPAVHRGLNVVGLQRRGFADEDIRCLKVAYRKLFLKKDLNLGKQLDELKTLPEAENKCVQRVIEFIESSPRGVCR
ncbi:acyl-ACP--UDP-N-acetylglucosamine O-acyltransferase [Persicirhabdus sediminis]|uniref:Acyl-[acyl-carrier-protein]--UDP-N-acetylglucosamine O-acyltransferase n=1 Tax=Persicirhabdus sediminis TaxID=454144 RepID=A0A8J7SKP9_9BACT|nr:acyl-ACP--UDP-N-acetylglucosamine O-acyltransferase [Persicirhabdus sediminis]MBK1790915.1 acyl-ACP--UDP-N-acetylglucosamine O-acyltransferase [Persicirhabdus sediminis]